VLGIKNKVVDALIEELIKAPDRASLVAHTRALDRVLQYGYYLIPHYHVAAFRVAYWDKYRRPATAPKYTVGLDTWWVDPAAEHRSEAKKARSTHQVSSPTVYLGAVAGRRYLSQYATRKGRDVIMRD